MGISQPYRLCLTPSIPIGKVGCPFPSPSLWNFSRQPRSVIPLRESKETARGFDAQEQRHNFTVKALEKPGIFKPRPYIYICVRCRYTFLVNQRRGSIVALDREAKPVPEPENSKRLATFAQGPCPAFRFRHRLPRRKTVELAKPKVKRSLSGIFALATFIGAGMRNPYLRGFDSRTTLAIAPQDLMS